MREFRWCSRCHCGFELADAPLDQRGDLYCPDCNASAVYVMHWGYARSLYRHFPEVPESLERYSPTPECG